MCGILGGWTNYPLSQASIDQGLAQIIHRGPDEVGLFQRGPVFLGIRRLSIIDVLSGTQPVFNEDRAIVAVLNGEIYNYLELMAELKGRGHVFSTKSDTEVLVHLYEDMGNEMVSKLRGMFAFAIWDDRHQRLFLARDRFGKKPLYYSQPQAGGLFFASELKALRLIAEPLAEHWTIRPQGIYDYLSLGFVPQPATIFDRVQMLEPGHSMSWDGRQLTKREYWKLEATECETTNYQAVLERVRSLIADAVKMRLRSDVPLGILLSGGIDSSIVAYEASKALGPGLHTFSIGVDDKKLDESGVASHTAAQLGMKNTCMRLNFAPLEMIQYLAKHFDQPFADASAIPSYAVCRLARQHVAVVLNGDGGDELFAGYRRDLAAAWADKMPYAPPWVWRLLCRVAALATTGHRSRGGFVSRFARGMSQIGGARYLAWTNDMLDRGQKQKYWRGTECAATEDWITNKLGEIPSALQQQRVANIQINLVNALLVKMDMASMAASVEARSPFLDHVLAEFSFSLPCRYLLRGGSTKPLLRDAYQGRLPAEVLAAPKRGFEIPLSHWLHGDMRELVHDLVLCPNARVASYLDSSFVSECMSFRRGSQGNQAQTAYALLILELWLRGMDRGNF
jgi:asparagine synthase (glutamine-hydrolysing)